MKLFFVMGAPKSGTTWLQTILNTHPQVSCFGEGHFVDQIALPMQALLQHYNRQLALVSELVYGGQPYYAPLRSADITALIRSTILGLMQRPGPPPQSLWWGDKTPAYSSHITVLDRVFPGCRFIDILRDPRDVAVSVLYHAQRFGKLADVEGDFATRRHLIANAMTTWLKHVTDLDQAAAGLGERLLHVRYLDLIEAPEPQLRRLFAHLPGIAVTEDIIRFVQERCSFTAMSGGRAPGQTDDGSFFRSGTHGQHRTDLRPEEVRFVEDRLGPTMRRLGIV